ncbi:hypothetical protein FB381_2973 [Nocardioides albertanoniae]|uniref:Uncharacterized protein n=1 Tax=Nocardioides albertanoniae TaxID=1175486 RepID=A0A543A900_9ACTN|nr:hypothetical protein [Nocardioides albertanoniae]TQL69072.1 hypothetical protein FB381_2973 [Nocardioides albertanoniae]
MQDEYDDVRREIAEGSRHAEEAGGLLAEAIGDLEESIRVLKGTTYTTSQEAPGLALSSLNACAELLAHTIGELQAADATAVSWANSL